MIMGQNVLKQLFIVGLASLSAACTGGGFLSEEFDNSLRTSAETVVYGEDSRQEVKDVSNSSSDSSLSFSKQISASMAIISANKIKMDSESSGILHTKQLKKIDNLCDGERFSEQLVLAKCTATLIAPDLVLTAGHCFPKETSCAETKLVTHLSIDSVVLKNQEQVYLENIYSCKEVEFLQLSSAGGYDFAFIRLDRPVTGVSYASSKESAEACSPIQPINIRESRDVVAGESVYGVSYSSGLALKFAMGDVLSSFDKSAGGFRAEVDVFSGSSGGMIYSVDDNKPLGIIIGGESDYVYDEERKCNTVKTCDTGACRGETILSLNAIHELMDQLKSEYLIEY